MLKTFPNEIKLKKKFLYYLFVLGLLVISGGFILVYTGPGSVWLRNSVGGLVYVAFWVVLFSMLLKKKPLKTTLVVLFATCGLEVLQLVKTPFLSSLRSTFAGAILLGNSFNPIDFYYYAAGAILGFLIVCGIEK